MLDRAIQYFESVLSVLLGVSSQELRACLNESNIALVNQFLSSTSSEMILFSGSKTGNLSGNFRLCNFACQS